MSPAESIANAMRRGKVGRRYRCVDCETSKFITVDPTDADTDIRTGCRHCETITIQEPDGGRVLSYYRDNETRADGQGDPSGGDER